jgi:hydroxyacylglutathione hydrolase
MIASFAGWYLAPEDDLLLVAEGADQAERAARSLARIGIDRVHGYLVPSLPEWAAAGHRFDRVPVIDTAEVQRRVEGDASDWTLLDVRDENEFDSGRVPGSIQAWVGELAQRANDLDQDRRYTVMCGSGSRATIAASLLLRQGFVNVDLYLGSFAAWAVQGLETSSAR